jgi:hypothetical protein
VRVGDQRRAEGEDGQQQRCDTARVVSHEPRTL